MNKRRIPPEAIERAMIELEAVARMLTELEPALRSVLGFNETIEYKGVSFHVGKRFVIADLRPLAFLGLMEEFDEVAAPAIERLYERILPLLKCRHQWVPQGTDGLANVDGSTMDAALSPNFCKRCTAHAPCGLLPCIGRGFHDGLNS